MNSLARTAASIAALMIASSASAGGYVVPTIPIEISTTVERKAAAPTPAFDWTGPYAGITAGRTKIDLEHRPLVQEPDTIIEHPAETKEVTIEHPAVTEVVEHPEVTEDRVTTIEHPAVTEDRVTTIDHPDVTEDRVKTIEHPAVTDLVEHPAVTEIVEHPAVTEDRVTTIEHPAVIEKVKVGEEKLWVPTGPEDMFGGCHYGNNTCPVRDPSDPTGWKHVSKYEDRVVRDAWTETNTETVIIEPARTETVVVKDAWTETVVIEPARTETVTETVVVEPARTETVTETVVVEPARTETVTVSPAWTEKKVVETKPAWTEVISGTWVVGQIHTLKEEANTFGVFAGYRYQFDNRAVIGAEAGFQSSKGVEIDGVGGFDFDTRKIEAQAGFSAGRFLPYVAAGVARTDGNTGWMAAVGVDYALTDRVIVGAKFSQVDYGDISETTSAKQKTVDLRLGLKF